MRGKSHVEYYIFPCCGAIAWCRLGVESFLWSLRDKPYCPQCGKSNRNAKAPAPERVEGVA